MDIPLKALLKGPGTWPIRATYRLAFRLGERRRLRGVPVSLPDGNPEADRLSARLDRALELVERYDPAALRILTHDFRGILVFGRESTHLAYSGPHVGYCVLTERFVKAPETTAQRLALTFVHEATHARLRRAGIEYERGLRKRIELVCARRELAFAKRIPDNTDAIARIEGEISSWTKAGEERWSDARFASDDERAMRENGLPRWLVRVFAALRRRRAA